MRRVGLLAALLIVLAPLGAKGAVSLDETVTGGSATTSPVTLPSTQGGSNQTYVLSIAPAGNADVTGVSGGGLTWTEQKYQCAGGNKGASRLWTAQGSPGSSFQVQITYADGEPLCAVLSRYSGVDSFEDPTGENTGGENAPCSASKTSAVQLTLTSTQDGSVHAIGISPRDKTISSVSPGYGLVGSDVFGTGGGATRCYVYEKAFGTATTDTFQATLSGSTWWATTGIVLVPSPAGGLVVQKTAETTPAGSFHIPGTDVIYTIRVTNLGPAVDLDTVVITEAIPAELEFRSADFDGVTSGPIRFDDGTPTSALTYTFVSLGDGGDDVGFQDVGPGYAYTPSTPYDGAVTAIQIDPKGTLAGDVGAGHPYFEVRFRTRVR